MQRNTSLFHRFAAGHLGTAYTSGNLDLDTFGAHTHRRCDSGFHGAAERYAALQLAGDVLSHDHGVNLRTLHFEDIDLDLLTGEFLQLLLEFIDLLAALADDDTGAGRRDRDRNLASSTNFSEKSLPPNQLESQPRMMPRRFAIGLTFCPI